MQPFQKAKLGVSIIIMKILCHGNYQLLWLPSEPTIEQARKRASEGEFMNIGEMRNTNLPWRENFFSHVRLLSEARMEDGRVRAGGGEAPDEQLKINFQFGVIIIEQFTEQKIHRGWCREKVFQPFAR